MVVVRWSVDDFVAVDRGQWCVGAGVSPSGLPGPLLRSVLRIKWRRAVAVSELDRIFTVTDSDTVRSTVVRAVAAGVWAAGDSYEFGRPRTDGHTYGNDLWRFVCFELAEQLGELPGAAVCRPRGSFLVDLGEAVLYPFRYGAATSADVTGFRLADSQFRRDLLVDPVTAPYLFWPEVVLVPYAANPGAGLLRAFVGGARITGGDLLDWVWLEELDLGGSSATADGSGLPSSLTVPAFARAPEPELDLALTEIRPARAGG